MNESLIRSLSLIDCISVADAVTQVSSYQLTSPLTIIDMSCDFNQNRWLGQELCDTLVFFDDASNLNGLLSVLGCIKAPHRIFLACNLSNINDYFKKYILLPRLEKIAQGDYPSVTTNSSLVEQDEIQSALRILQASTGISHLIGERGSGKSTLLGQLLAAEITNGKQGGLLSSPFPAASKNTLKTCDQRLNHRSVSRETLLYCLPQDLILNLNCATWILIDEAATYPKNMIEQVINHVKQHQKKLILSTTIEGYESTGQSYRINYLQESNNVLAKLNVPKRFSSADPLYCLTKTLYQTDTIIGTHTSTTNDGIYTLTTAELRENGWTTACFALLREAHYKTTPNDLARLYCDDAVFVIQINQGKVIAALYAISEVLPQSVESEAIFNGKRRVKNAFTQQAILHAYASMACANNDKTSYFRNSNILRISRIATDKNYRRQGIASDLIRALTETAIAKRMDFISTSFSGSQQNIAFWLSQSFVPARIGLYPNKYNHEFAVILLYGLTPTAQRIAITLHQYLDRHLRHFWKNYLPQFQALLSTQHTHKTQEYLIEELNSVIDYHRDIHWALPILAQNQTIRTQQVFLSIANHIIHDKKEKIKYTNWLREIREQICSLPNTTRDEGL